MAKDKQLFQIQNILDTILEATDHFFNLVKNKELNQSIFMFGSIVEGIESILGTLESIDKRFSLHTSKISNYLFLIADELQKGNFVKISEIIQFSFRPELKKLRNSFLETVGNQHDKNIISIGVFNSWANPKDFYPDERTKAMIDASVKQDAVLYFFTSKDVDFENKQIHADTFEKNTWKRVTVPFPDVINNVGAGKRSQVERKLRREIPFTSFHVGNKYTLPKRMIKYRKFVELLVPFTVCVNEKGIHDFMQQNNRVVFKALGSNRGENIYFITKKGNRYILLDQKKERIINQQAFDQFIQQTILAKKGSYIIQRYVHTRTKNDEPYHFRAHVQKNGEGKWQLTHIYPRIGSKKSNLSNISTEGRVEDFPTFLREEFGEIKGASYEKKILKLSLDVAWHLDKLYGLVLDELGLDFAIDETGKIWMHEANNGPQTAYHEEKRAIHTIAYAKYIAKNGIMHTDAATKMAITKGQFQARNSNLPTVNDEKPVIGMLTDKHIENSLTLELAKHAVEKDLLFFTFTPKDIDFDLGLVKACCYENEQWVSKIAEYPDVIFDRLKMRGKEEAQHIYDEFEDIPFTNEWLHASNRFNLYTLIKKHNTNYIADFQKVTNPRSVFRFIESYGKVFLKPNITSFNYDTYSIEIVDKHTFLVNFDTKLKSYSEIQLRNWIKNLIKEKAFIVQQDNRFKHPEGTLEEIHLHLIKNDNDEWSFVSKDVLVLGRLDENIDIKREAFSNYMNDLKIERKIQNFANRIATSLEKESDIPISELELIIAMDEHHELVLLDIDPNGPKEIHDTPQFAYALIHYAESLMALESAK